MSWLNGIPVIGHGKALFHIVTGDPSEGGKAFLAATRSTAVIAGGAAGLVTAGPAGAIAGATGAGALTDVASSLITQKPQGLVECVDDIAIDISNGEIPVRTVLKTGFIVGLDAVSGVTAGGVADIAKSVTKSVAENTGKSIVKTIVVTEVQEASKSLAACSARSCIENTRTRETYFRSQRRNTGGSSDGGNRSSKPNSPSQPSKPSSSSNTNNRSNNTQTSNTSSGSSATSGSGSGSQPPKQNKNNKNTQKPEPESHWEAFMRIFNVSTLDDIIINGVHVFRRLETGQKKSLRKLIANLRKCGCLERVIKTVLNIFKKLKKSDTTFQNFLSLTQIVVTYITERAARRNDTQRDAARAGRSDLSGAYDRRREQLTDAVGNDPLTAMNLLELLLTLISQVEEFSCDPNFRSIYSAVAHYFKHRIIEEQGRILSVKEYYDLIISLLEKVKVLKEYKELTNGNVDRAELVFDRYFTVFGRRVRIVIKVQGGSLELSSCYILETGYEDDEQSDEFVDGNKLPKKR